MCNNLCHREMLHLSPYPKNQVQAPVACVYLRRDHFYITFLIGTQASLRFRCLKGISAAKIQSHEPDQFSLIACGHLPAQFKLNIRVGISNWNRRLLVSPCSSVMRLQHADHKRRKEDCHRKRKYIYLFHPILGLDSINKNFSQQATSTWIGVKNGPQCY